LCQVHVTESYAGLCVFFLSVWGLDVYGSMLTMLAAARPGIEGTAYSGQGVRSPGANLRTQLQTQLPRPNIYTHRHRAIVSP